MTLQSHLKILLIMTTGWLLFWVVGLPDYYQQYSTRFMISFDAAVLPPVALVVHSALKKFGRGKSYFLSLWLAFYISVPLFLYDLLYCGYYRGHGLGFVRTYWYLTVYYILPWVVFPALAWRIERSSPILRGGRGT